MLQTIRDRATGWIAWIVVILISVPFALWGINQYFSGHVEADVAKVNGTEITLRAFQERYQQERNRLEEQLGPRYTELVNESRLRKRVLQQMVNEEVLAQSADAAGFRISNSLLAAEIHGIPAFQEKGQFSDQRYAQVLSAQGMTPLRFEPMFRRELLIGQLQDGVIRTGLATPWEVDQFIRLRDQTRDFFYLSIPISRYERDAKVSEGQIQQYYDAHKDKFMRPEEVSIDYLDLDVSKLASSIPVSDEDLRALYKQQAGNFVTPEQRRVRHILIRVPKDADQQTVAAARSRAEALLKRLHDGASFAKLAKEYSQDPGSAAQGGDLGFFAKGTMTPAFDKAVFAIQKKGEIVGPIRTAFGFHIIQLEDVKPSREMSFDEVKTQLAADYRKRKAEDRYYALADRLTNLTYEHPATLQIAAQKLGLQVQRTGLFSRQGGTGLASNTKVVAAAFSSDVLNGNNSDPIEISPTQTIVIRVHDHKPAALRPLAEVHQQVEDDLRDQYGRAQAKKLAEQLLAELRAGRDPQRLAKADDLGFKQLKAVGRGDTAVDAKILRLVFGSGRPQKGHADYGDVELDSGAYAIVGVTQVSDGDPSGIPKDKRLVDEQALAQVAGTQEFTGLLADLKQHAKVEMEEQSLTQP
ncbi:MAG: hypothetical protein B7Z66_00460 [Chromatiales bacterium 21-64-14]|nr:MAG: hypothetical protein B7Z66_00460 [Chromatiales bacterium 21-64-14]HQU16446.1 SurA N-terminal domain-containing protein [Gammaproteobacteria bacterium]